MKVTEVRVHPVNDDEKLKAFVSIALDDAIMIRDLRIIQGNKGLFVAMPSKKSKDGTYRDTAHPLNNAIRQMIEEVVLNEYWSIVGK
jgi:stage V sporulation protein G